MATKKKSAKRKVSKVKTLKTKKSKDVKLTKEQKIAKAKLDKSHNEWKAKRKIAEGKAKKENINVRTVKNLVEPSYEGGLKTDPFVIRSDSQIHNVVYINDNNDDTHTFQPFKGEGDHTRFRTLAIYLGWSGYIYGVLLRNVETGELLHLEDEDYFDWNERKHRDINLT